MKASKLIMIFLLLGIILLFLSENVIAEEEEAPQSPKYFFDNIIYYLSQLKQTLIDASNKITGFYISSSVEEYAAQSVEEEQTEATVESNETTPDSGGSSGSSGGGSSGSSGGSSGGGSSSPAPSSDPIDSPIVEEDITCEEGYFCKDENTAGHRLENCDWLNEYTCSDGCLDGVCGEASCTETDNGDDIYTKGTATDYRNKVRTDSCIDENRLEEWWCNPELKLVAGRGDYCPEGYICSDGACITPPTCIPRWDCENEGTYAYQNEDCSWTDREYCENLCVGEGEEAHCTFNCEEGYFCKDENTRGYQIETCDWINEEICENGCENGACIGGWCTDTDGGDNIYEQGTTEDYRGEVRTDSCFGTDKGRGVRLTEWACDENLNLIWGYGDYCPEGYSCSEGACVEYISPE